MSVTTTNLIQGPATLYVGAFGATEPAASAVNTAPPSPTWTDVGATDGGVKLSVTQSFSALTVDQIIDTPERRQTAREVQIITQMAEPTLENLVVALNGGTAATAAGVTTYTPTDSTAYVPVYSAFILDGQAPANFRRRVIVRKAINTQNADQEYKKDGQAYWTVTLASHYVSASVLPWVVYDQTA